MEAGDGRNQSLFNYILTLQSADLQLKKQGNNQVNKQICFKRTIEGF